MPDSGRKFELCRGGDVSLTALIQVELTTAPHRAHHENEDLMKRVAADDGRVYQASFTVQRESTVTLQGCVLAVLCQTRTWTRSN